MNVREWMHAAAPPRLRALLRDAVVRQRYQAGTMRAALRELSFGDDLLVLTLHRVVPDERVALCRSPQGMVLRESLFGELLTYLAEAAEVVSPWRLHEDAPLHRPRVLLTFDDGWVDNFEVARRHLRERGVQACFFLTTGLLGQREPFWPERCLGFVRCARGARRPEAIVGMLEALAPGKGRPGGVLRDEEGLLGWLKRFPAAAIEACVREAHARLHAHDGACAAEVDEQEALMSWEQVRELAAEGHLMASHSASHALLSRMKDGAVREELATSLAALRAQLPKSAAWISYPNGDCSAAVRRAAAKLGYAAGFMNVPGVWRAKGDPMGVPRINVWDRTVADRHGHFHPAFVEDALYWRALHA